MTKEEFLKKDYIAYFKFDNCYDLPKIFKKYNPKNYSSWINHLDNYNEFIKEYYTHDEFIIKIEEGYIYHGPDSDQTEYNTYNIYDIFPELIPDLNDIILKFEQQLTITTTKMEEKLVIKLSDILNHFKNGVERYECDNQGVGSIQSIYSLTDEECNELFKNPLIKGRRVKKLEKQTTNI